MKVVQTPIKNNYDLYLSDDFGYREFYYNNKYYSGFHKGIDITNLGKDSEGYNLISIAQTNDFLYHKGVTPDDSIIASEYMITKQKYVISVD